VVGFLAIPMLAAWVLAECRGSPMAELLRRQMRAPSHSTAAAQARPSGAIPPTKRSPVNRPSQVIGLFQEGCPCSEVILRAFGPSLGISRGEAFEIADALNQQFDVAETCGAVTGALVVLVKHRGGVRTGVLPRAAEKDIEDFAARFKARHGSVRCRRLLRVVRGSPTVASSRTAVPTPSPACSSLFTDAAELLETSLDGDLPLQKSA